MAGNQSELSDVTGVRATSRICGNWISANYSATPVPEPRKKGLLQSMAATNSKGAKGARKHISK